VRIVLASSEIVPFTKTGGMADVVGALGDALAARGHQVMTVSPAYGHVDPASHGFVDTGLGGRADLGGRTLRYNYLAKTHAGVTHVMIQHPLYDRRGIYGDSHGTFGDNHLRFALLSRAAIDAARTVPVGGQPLGEDVVFHAHDWHTSLMAVYLNATYRPLGLFARAPSVLTLHNLAHQGLFSSERFTDLELPPRWHSAWGLEWYGAMSLLKGGILQADQLTTVSPTYAREILSDEGAFGMEGPLRHRVRDLHGILNGIDANLWNPAADPFLDAAYDADQLDGKRVCKAALQAEVRLPVDPEVPLVGSIGRLDPQKGVHWLIESIPWMVQEHGAQVVVLGSAQAAHTRFEHALKQMEQRFPNHVRALIGFSERMAHRIEAGADLFAMPSQFEPCGLNQLYSLRYGTPPVVRGTGGLVDSVRPHDPSRDAGTGWMFHDPSGGAFREALHWALHTWRNHPDSFERLVRRGMKQDLSWEAVVPYYEEVYLEAARRRGLQHA
jgi:starch synthase